jgi:endonuclease YncB( thermonuclease family)
MAGKLKTLVVATQAVCLVLAPLAYGQEFPPELPPEQEVPLAPPPPMIVIDTPTPEADVSRVIDGSTLDASIDGQRVAIGYLGVDTPPANEPCGQQALARNRELAGTRVLLMADPQYEFDIAGRRLYYAFTLDGTSIDEVLVREGLGRAVRTEGVEGSQLQAAEAEAAAAGIGCVWQDYSF